MFNENDNKNQLFKNEKKSKNTDLYDFSDFSHDQNDEKIKEKKSPADSTQGISFREFEEIFVTEEEVKEETKESPLKEYFKRSRASQKELKVEKESKKKEKKPKRIRKRKKQREIEDFDDVKKRRAFKYKRKKYTKVADFVAYLNENYMDLDEIASNILNDENFHGWLKKRSKRFDESIADFRDIIEIIGN